MNIESKDDIFYDMENHLLSDEKPSQFLIKIVNAPGFSEFPFEMLLKLKTTGQQLEHHP